MRNNLCQDQESNKFNVGSRILSSVQALISFICEDKKKRDKKLGLYVTPIPP